MSRKRKKRKLKVKRVILAIVILLVLAVGGVFGVKVLSKVPIIKKSAYLSSTTSEVLLYTYNSEDKKLNEDKEVVRGQKVTTYADEVTEENTTYQKIEYEKKEYYVNKDNLVDSEKKVVKEKEIYVEAVSTKNNFNNTEYKITLKIKNVQELDNLIIALNNANYVLNVERVKN